MCRLLSQALLAAALLFGTLPALAGPPGAGRPCAREASRAPCPCGAEEGVGPVEAGTHGHDAHAGAAPCAHADDPCADPDGPCADPDADPCPDGCADCGCCPGAAPGLGSRWAFDGLPSILTDRLPRLPERPVTGAARGVFRPPRSRS